MALSALLRAVTNILLSQSVLGGIVWSLEDAVATAGCILGCVACGRLATPSAVVCLWWRLCRA